MMAVFEMRNHTIVVQQGVYMVDALVSRKGYDGSSN